MNAKKIGEKYPRHEIMPGEMFCHDSSMSWVFEAVSHDDPAIIVPPHMHQRDHLCIDTHNCLLWTEECAIVTYCGKVRILPTGEKCTRGLMVLEDEDEDE